jgi:NitT/TauT family transport system permease protein
VTPFTVRPASRPAAPWADLLLVAGVLAALGGFAAFGREWTSPLLPEPIDLSLAALPRYTMFSLSRGLLAYLLSVVFSVVYGTAAARSRRAERLMIPVLDVLQSVPVLSFLPGLVVTLVGLFPSSRVGLEIACVLAIFTGQVWNMTFSYHASLRSVPAELTEVTRLHRFTPRRRLLGLELPSGAIGLVWNSMMSMAGGWFFLTILESFRIGSSDYRLPGLGSYMAAATEAGNGPAVVAAVVAMAAMILGLDQLLWRPLIAWSEKFKSGDTGTAERPRSWAYDLVRRSRFAAWLAARRTRDVPYPDLGLRPAAPARSRAGPAVAWTSAALAAAAAVTGTIGLMRTVAPLGAPVWLGLVAALGWTALRVAVAVLLGTLWALPVGIAIGRSPRALRRAQPLIQIAASFPVPMLFPLVAPALLAAGVAPDAIAIGLMMLGTQWYVLFNVVAGAASLPDEFREVARSFRLPAGRRFVVVDLAGVFPALVTGIVTAAGGAWNASIVAEAVTYRGGSFAVPGIGSTLSACFASGDAPRLVAATVVLAAALVVVNRFAWRPLHRLAESRFALNR